MNNPEDYIMILKWGRLVRWFNVFIRQQQEKAAKDGAPLSAIYFDHAKGEWRTAEELISPQLRIKMGLPR